MLRAIKTKKYRNNITIVGIVLMICALIIGLLVQQQNTSASAIPMVFPVIGKANFSNDFEAARSNGKHYATDIFANKHQMVVSAVDGIVKHVAYPEPSWGYMVQIEGSDGYIYNYIHLNNDIPGTDNGKGGGMYAYAPDMQRGNPVKKGQLIGYVGDSGNAENTPPHLHFEIYKDNNPINPYESLRRAQKLSKPVDHPQLSNEYLPYGVSTKLKANLAIGNLDGNSDTQETVIIPDFGGGPHVKAIDESGRTIANFFAYDLKFRGGGNVDTGDIDGDGIDEIITGAGRTGGPHVKIFTSKGQLISQFFAYDKADRNGIRVAAGDVDNDGEIEIITAPLSGNAAPVRIFNINGKLLSSFYPYTEDYKDGLDIAVGDINGDGVDEIVTGPGKGSGPHIRIFDGTGKRLHSYFVYDLDNRGGVRVTVGDVIDNGSKEEVITAPDTYGGPHIKVMRDDGKHLRSNMFLETWWRSGYDVAAGDGLVKASAGEQRRTTVRTAL